MCQEFIQSVRNLKLRVGASCNGRKLEVCLAPLQKYYQRAETTCTTRTGILCFLERIQTSQQMTEMLRIQEQMIRVSVAKGAPRYQQIYSFFDVVSMKPQSADYLFYLVCLLFDLYQEKTSQLLISLLNVSLPNWGLEQDCPLEVKYGISDLFARRIWSLAENSGYMYAFLRNRFGEGGFTMFPTSGDEHMGGFRPYYVTEPDRQWVYKPRDMRVDFYVLEMIRFSNTIFPGELKLPAAEIRLSEDHTGWMQFVEHVQDMTEDRAALYFRKLGALFCLAKLLGITDLHEENIMATAEGPVIIDAECAFLSSIVEAEDFSDLLFGKIIHVFNDEIFCDATFRADGQIPKFYEQSASFLEGYRIAAECFMNHMDALLAKYMEILGQPFLIRLVPVQTADFYGDIYTYYTDSLYRLQKLSGRKESILSALEPVLRRAHLFSDPEPGTLKAVERGELDPEILERSLANDFYHGQIPLLRLQYCLSGPCRMMIDGTSFWEVTENRSRPQIEEMIRNAIHWMNEEETLRSVREKAERNRPRQAVSETAGQHGK